MSASFKFFGEDEIRIKGQKEKIINLLELNSVEYEDIKVFEGAVSLKVPSFRKKRIERYFALKGMEVETVEKRGLPAFIYRILKRPGLVLGGILFTLVMIFYGNFVFDIKVHGNETLSDKYILDALESEGFGVGSYIPNIDFDELSVKVPVSFGDISWIFVNMMGNVAHVEVREYKGAEDKNQTQTPRPPIAPGTQSADGEINDEMTDLVAVSDGQIYRFEVSSGIIKAAIGQTVLKGQILVSGWERGEKSDYFGKSKGRVFAKVVEQISVGQSFEVEEVVEQSRELQKKSIKILGFEIKVFENSSILGESCDIIEESYKLTLPDGTELPVIITKRYSVITKSEKKTLSKEEAKALAEKKFEELLERDYGNAEIIRVERTENAAGGKYMLFCRIYCIKDISLEVPSVRDEEFEKKD